MCVCACVCVCGVMAEAMMVITVTVMAMTKLPAELPFRVGFSNICSWPDLGCAQTGR